MSTAGTLILSFSFLSFNGGGGSQLSISNTGTQFDLNFTVRNLHNRTSNRQKNTSNKREYCIRAYLSTIIVYFSSPLLLYIIQCTPYRRRCCSLACGRKLVAEREWRGPKRDATREALPEAPLELLDYSKQRFARRPRVSTRVSRNNQRKPLKVQYCFMRAHHSKLNSFILKCLNFDGIKRIYSYCTHRNMYVIPNMAHLCRVFAVVHKSQVLALIY